MRFKPEELRLHPRYSIILPIELQSLETVKKNPGSPPIRFQSTTIDASLGGVLVDLVNKTQGMDPNWKPSWFRERFFWLHIKGISTIPEGIFAKAKAVRLLGEDETHPEAVGLEFQDLVTSVMARLKMFLDSLTK